MQFLRILRITVLDVDGLGNNVYNSTEGDVAQPMHCTCSN